jgi:hypothetical protein
MIKGSSRIYLSRKKRNMFQICVDDQKVQGFKEMHYYIILEKKNAMIRKIKL